MCLRLGNSLAGQWLGLGARGLASITGQGTKILQVGSTAKGKKNKKAKARFEGMECQAQEVGWKSKRNLKCNLGRSLTA